MEGVGGFIRQKEQECFFGHTQAPRLYFRDGSVVGLPLEEVLIEPQRKYFINVGSVGQPRDGDWRAAYAIFDFDKKIVRLRRVRYDIASTKLKIVNAGLPSKLAERLFHGR